MLTSGGAGTNGSDSAGGGAAIAPETETAAPRDEPAAQGRALSSDSAAPETSDSLPVPPSPGFAPEQTERRIERAASLTVAAAGTPSSTESALDDALGSLVGACNFLLRALGMLLPVALVAGLGWLAVAALRRRRREAVLR